LEDMVAIAFKSLLGGTRGEEAGPEALGLMGMGQEVLCLVREALEALVQGVQIASSS